jgi:hypothetical protein
MKWTWYISCVGEKRNLYRVLMGMQERDHYRSSCRGGDNIKINLKEIGWEGMGWIDLAQEGAFGRLLWAQYVLSGYIN